MNTPVYLYCTNEGCSRHQSPTIHYRQRYEQGLEGKECLSCGFELSKLPPHEQPIKEDVYYELIRDWQHPLSNFEAGHIHTANVWCVYIGCTLSEPEFQDKFARGEFKDWFKKV